MEMRVFCLIPLALCVASGALAAVTSAKGEIFEPKLSPDKPLFFYENTRNDAGTESRTVYSDVKGKPVVEETTTYEGGKLKRYTYNQLQVDEKGEIEVRDGKVFYTYTAQGKTEKDNEDLEDNMLVPDMIGAQILKDWAELMKGETIKIRILLLERLDNIGFKLFKDKERDFNGKPAVDIVMKPSSIFIAAIAPSFLITVEKDAPHRLLETFGRLPVRVPNKTPPVNRKDWDAIDARLTFAAAPPAQLTETPPPAPQPPHPDPAQAPAREPEPAAKPKKK